MSQAYYIVSDDSSGTYASFSNKQELQQIVNTVAARYQHDFPVLFARLFDNKGVPFIITPGHANDTTVNIDIHKQVTRSITLKKDYVEVEANKVPTIYHEMFHSMQYASATFLQYLLTIVKQEQSIKDRILNNIKWFIEGPATAMEILYSRTLTVGSRLYGVSKGTFDFSSLSYSAFPIFHYMETHGYPLYEMIQFMDDINYLVTGDDSESYMFVDDFIRYKNWAKQNGNAPYSPDSAKSFLTYIKTVGKDVHIDGLESILFAVGRAVADGVYNYNSQLFNGFTIVGQDKYVVTPIVEKVSTLPASASFKGFKIIRITNDSHNKVTVASNPSLNSTSIEPGATAVVIVVNGYSIK